MQCLIQQFIMFYYHFQHNSSCIFTSRSTYLHTDGYTTSSVPSLPLFPVPTFKVNSAKPLPSTSPMLDKYSQFQMR